MGGYFFIQNLGMWKYYNPNPTGRIVGDCSVRAVSKALNTDWETAYQMIANNGFLMGDVMSSDSVWGSVLREHGFNRTAIPNTCPDCYTAADFIADHPRGTFVLGFGNHTACVKNGVLFDSWDSRQLTPVYYWYKKAPPTGERDKDP